MVSCDWLPALGHGHQNNVATAQAQFLWLLEDGASTTRGSSLNTLKSTTKTSLASVTPFVRKLLIR